MKREVTVAREAGISMAGFVFGQLFRFGYNLAAARLLGADALGIYALVVAVVQIGEVLATGGLDAGLLRFVNLKDDEEQKRLIASAMKRAAISSAAVALLIVLLSGPIAGAMHGGQLLRLALCSAAAAIPLSVMTLMAGHAVQAFRKLMPKVVATQMIAPATLLVTMLAARYSLGVDAALLLPFVPASLMALAWIWPRFSRTTGVGFSSLLHGGFGDRAMTAYAMPLLAISMFSMLSHWIDIMMLGFLTDPHTVGLYQPAARTAGLLRSVLLAFSGIAAPMFAGYYGAHDVSGIRSLYDTVTRWILMIVMLPALVLAIFPVEVLSVFGSGFGDGAAALGMLAASALLQAWFGLGGTVLAMSGGERLSLVNQASALVLQAILHLLLIPVLGLNGAALSTLVVTVLLTALRMLELRHMFGIPFLSVKVWKPLLAGVLAGATMVALKGFLCTAGAIPAIATCAGAGAVVYALLIRAFRLEQEEMEVILKIIPFLNNHRTNEAP
ncbi:MAG: oligosaccharide flippase family protein [Chlorobiaceae bacterium]|nr:oligosaccharide flippase family protein [Chlorobiaceae bacterium]